MVHFLLFAVLKRRCSIAISLDPLPRNSQADVPADEPCAHDQRNLLTSSWAAHLSDTASQVRVALTLIFDENSFSNLLLATTLTVTFTMLSATCRKLLRYEFSGSNNVQCICCGQPSVGRRVYVLHFSPWKGTGVVSVRGQLNLFLVFFCTPYIMSTYYSG